MSKTPQEVESDFIELKEKLSEQQWFDPGYLLNFAKNVESSYPELSLRIMRRVQLLNNQLTKKLQHVVDSHKKSKDIEQKQSESVSSETQLNERYGNNELPQTESKRQQNIENHSDDINNKKRLYKRPIVALVVIPWALFLIYQTLIASPRYVSESQIIVEQPDSMATMDTGMALLSGLGVKPTGTDAELVKAFIYSADLINYLDEKLNLKEHYSSSDADFISRLGSQSSKEEFHAYFEKHVEVSVDQKSQVIDLKVQGFSPEFAQSLNELIVERAEWYINQIGNKLASEQLKFIQKEHELVEQRIRTTKKKLLEFQSKYGLLDPEAEGMAIQKIAYSIESLIAQRQAELKALKTVMSETSPQVTSIKNEINALEEQLLSERNRLTDTDDGESVSEILSKFVDFKVDMELALKAYVSSQVSLEKSRVEAYRQIKYLVIVESPTLAEDNAYPTIWYNLALLAVVLLMLFGIGKIIYSTIHEISK